MVVDISNHVPACKQTDGGSVGVARSNRRCPPRDLWRGWTQLYGLLFNWEDKTPVVYDHTSKYFFFLLAVKIIGLPFFAAVPWWDVITPVLPSLKSWSCPQRLSFSCSNKSKTQVASAQTTKDLVWADSAILIQCNCFIYIMDTGKHSNNIGHAWSTPWKVGIAGHPYPQRGWIKNAPCNTLKVDSGEEEQGMRCHC